MLIVTKDHPLWDQWVAHNDPKVVTSDVPTLAWAYFDTLCPAVGQEFWKIEAGSAANIEAMYVESFLRHGWYRDRLEERGYDL